MAADQSPLWFLPRIAAFQNLRALWRDERVQLQHDHNRNRRLLGDEVQDNPADDEMQDFSIHLYEDNSKKSEAPVVGGQAGSRWPLALALGLGLPAATAMWVLPQIIEALKPPAAVETVSQQYAPVLLPGKPAGAN